MVRRAADGLVYGAVVTTALGLLLFGCSFDALLHNTTSLGGDTAGERGNVGVLFINNTPFRAVFSFGAYDEYLLNDQPQLLQFGSRASGSRLDGNTQSEVQNIECSRVMSIGGAGLVARVQESFEEGEFDEDLLFEGVHFSSTDIGEDNANDANEGTAAAHEALIGVDYECGALVIYRFEYDETGTDQAFIIEQTVIPADSNRG